MHNKQRKIGFIMLALTLVVLALFAWMYISATHEAPSVDSGPNLAMTAMMVIIVLVLAYFTWRKLRK